MVKLEKFTQRHLPVPSLIFYTGVKLQNFASIFQLQSPSRLVSKEGNRTEIDHVLGRVDDCYVSSAYLVQFVDQTLKAKGSLKKGGAHSAQSFIARLC